MQILKIYGSLLHSGKGPPADGLLGKTLQKGRFPRERRTACIDRCPYPWYNSFRKLRRFSAYAEKRLIIFPPVFVEKSGVSAGFFQYMGFSARIFPRPPPPSQSADRKKTAVILKLAPVHPAFSPLAMPMIWLRPFYRLPRFPGPSPQKSERNDSMKRTHQLLALVLEIGRAHV